MDEPGSTAEDGGTQALVERVKAVNRATAESMRQLGIKHRPEDDEDAREPCLPDFLLWSRPVPVGGCEAVIVETMGNADALYRERKARTHALMRRVLRGAPLVQHDFHLPAEQPQAQRDRRFWLECRGAVTGPEAPTAAVDTGKLRRAAGASAR